MFFTSWEPQPARPCIESESVLRRIEVLKGFLAQQRPLSQEVLRRFRDDLLVRMTHHSNAIEGNTLTLNETQVVIMHGVTVGGKTLAEHIEAVNHKEALIWVLERAKAKGPSENCTIEDIRTIHKFILAGSNQAGQWREDQVMIAGSTHVPPRPEKISYVMASMMNWLEQDGPGFHPVERAARLHADLVTIHPFIDGNGRTARLLMNLELIRSGFPAVVIHNEDRLEYYDCLQKIQERGIFDDFLEFVCRTVERSFTPYWHLFDVSEEQIKALTWPGQF